MLFDWRQFRACAGHGLQRGIRVGQVATAACAGQAHRRGRATVLAQQGADAGADDRNRSRGPAHAQQEAAAVERLDGSLRFRHRIARMAEEQLIVERSEREAPADKGDQDPEEADGGHGEGSEVDGVAQQGHRQTED